MRILYIIPWIPYPLNSGGNQGFFNMVNRVRKEHQVSLLLYTHSSADRHNVEELRKVWPDVDIDCFDKHQSMFSCVELSMLEQRKCKLYSYIEKSMKRKQYRIFRSAYKNIERNKYEKESVLGLFVRGHSDLYESCQDLDNNFLNYVYIRSRQGFDLVQVEFFEYLPLIYALPDNVKKVFVHHELRFVRCKNELDLFDKIVPNDYIKYERQKDAEIAALKRYDNIIVMSEMDKNILRDYLPEQKIYVSPSAISPTPSDKNLGFHTAMDLVFVGSGGHFPNADGMLWFCMYVAPLLTTHGFLGYIYITGEWKKEFQNLIHQYCPHVEFVGFVDDIHLFLNGKITIVPIRIGSGMRMKIMDAIPSLSPIVTTSKGCEGLPLQNGTDCLIEDTPEGFADAVIKLAKSPEKQKGMVESALEKSRNILSGEALLQRRMDFYKIC